MAEGRSYGDYLREARERQGIDLVSMARMLHIRPDIVGAIENADFSKMPAHGYTKNMVRAYARQVGLDEPRISRMYAEARDEFEGVPSRSSAKRSSSQERRTAASSRSLSEPSRRVERPSRTSSSTSVRERPDGQNRAERAQSSAAVRRGRGSGRATDLVASLSQAMPKKESRVHSSFTQGTTQPGLSARSSRGGSSGSSRLPQINVPVLLVVIAAIVIIVVAVILFNGGSQSVNEVPDIPISGLTDTSATDENSQTPQVEATPSSVVFSFSVEEGQKAWVTIYEDGSTTPVYAAVAEGPVTEDFEVTGTLRFETANITPVTLTVDGEEVKASPASSGTNYVYTVDFSAYLAQWKKDHGVDEEGEGSPSSSSASSDGSSSSSVSSASVSSSASTR